MPIINVLPEDVYAQEHIPRSTNIPLGKDDFVAQVESVVASKEDPVVVYCASDTCDASPKAARQLEGAGFTNVLDYEGGTAAWKEQGLPVESSNS